MNKFGRKIKILSSLLGAIMIFFLFSIPTSLKASECQIIFQETNTSSINNSKIKEEISSYLLNNSLYPVLSNDPIKYEITNIVEASGIVYTVGMLSQGKNCLMALFSIQNGWIWTTTDLLFITTAALPPSPLLFRDICHSAQAALPKSLSNYHVLIQNLENPPSKDNWQLWSFYNRDEWIELVVIAITTPDGGTDFSIISCEQ